MSTIVFSPYGTESQESGILYLLASYMNAQELPVVRATCNGVVSVCDQDRNAGWARGVSTCFHCISDARNLQKWSQIQDTELSSYILPEEIERTRRWVLRLDAQELSDAEFDGVRLFEFCESTFQERFSVVTPEPGVAQHERFARRLILSAARMKLIVRRLLREGGYTNAFVAGGSGYLTSVFKAEAERRDLSVSCFSWRSGSRHVEIVNPQGESYLCEILLDSVANMRRDVQSWPPELIEMLDELLGYLSVSIPVDEVVGIAS